MDKHLRPSRFNAEPNHASSEREWKHWHRTFSNFLTTIDSQRPDKLNTLINYVSADIYEHIADATSYNNAITILQNMYVKPRNDIFNRHLVASRRQSEGETLDQYIQELTKLSKECNFAAVSADQYRQEYIRDSFINGLHSREIRQRLLENNALTMEEAFEKARAMEMAQKHSASFSGTNSISAAIPLTSEHNENSQTALCGTRSTDNINQQTNDKCFFCGLSRHPRSKCPAKESVCNSCSKIGHWRKVCKSGRQNDRQKSSPTTSAAAMPYLAALTSVHKLNNDSTFTTTYIKQKAVKTMVDSGSVACFISRKTAKRLNLFVIPSDRQVTMADASHKSAIDGEAIVDMTLNGKLYTGLTVGIVKNLFIDLILGKDFLKRHKQVTFQFNGSLAPLELASVSNSGLQAMKIDPPPVFTNISPECKPIASKSRRYSHSDATFIQSETNRLLAEGIIEPSISPWRSQVLVTSNESHKKRMVVDYSQTVNTYTNLDAYPLPRIDDMVNKISKYSVFSTVDLKSAYHQIPLKEEDKQYTAFQSGNKLYQFTRLPFGVTNGTAAFQRIIDNIIETEKLEATFGYVDNVTICGHDQNDHDANLQRFFSSAEKYGMTFNPDKSILSAKSITLLGYIIENGNLKPDPVRLKPLIDLPVPLDPASQRSVVGIFAYYCKWIERFSEKIRPLSHNSIFPPPSTVVKAFKLLKEDILKATVTTIDPDVPFTVETDASDFAIAATLNQAGRPVAFFSRTLNASEAKHHSVEKEAYAIVEALRQWRHLLIGRHFKIITDQKSVSFMYNNRTKGKVKNDKIARWRLELSDYQYDIVYRPGINNPAADAFSRAKYCSAMLYTDAKLCEIHNALCHPGITRMNHFVKTRNLPYSINDIKKMTELCQTCSELKPRFHNSTGTLIKATLPFQQLNVDFKGPLPSTSSTRYLLTIVDEFSRFPFAFPCKDMKTETIIKCFEQLFAIFGRPSYIHSDRGTDFLANDLKNYLNSRSIATSRTSRYNPRGNGQVERYNGIIWRTIMLALKTKNLPTTQWETVLPEAMHSIRSLLCTATNCTPHERLFSYQRRATSGNAVPSWLLSPGPVYVKRHVRQSKYDPIVEEAELLEANPEYAFVQFKNGNQSTVSLRDLAPCNKPPEIVEAPPHPLPKTSEAVVPSPSHPPTNGSTITTSQQHSDIPENDAVQENILQPRRSSRHRQPPERFCDTEHSTI